MAYLCEKCAKENTHAGFVEVNFVDLQELLIDSVRYSLGRMTYHVPDTMKMVRKYHRFITDDIKKIIIDDIKWWLEGTHTFGDYSEEWAELAKKLQEGVVNEK